VVQEEPEVDVITRVKLAVWSEDEEQGGELLHLPLLLEPELEHSGGKRKAEALDD
jgi:hypothetical protein